MAGNRGKASAVAPVCTRPHLDYSLRKRHLGLLALLRRSLCFAPHAPIAKTNPHPSSLAIPRTFPEISTDNGGSARSTSWLEGIEKTEAGFLRGQGED